MLDKADASNGPGQTGPTQCCGCHGQHVTTLVKKLNCILLSIRFIFPICRTLCAAVIDEVLYECNVKSYLPIQPWLDYHNFLPILNRFIFISHTYYSSLCERHDMHLKQFGGSTEITLNNGSGTRFFNLTAVDGSVIVKCLYSCMERGESWKLYWPPSVYPCHPHPHACRCC